MSVVRGFRGGWPGKRRWSRRRSTAETPLVRAWTGLVARNGHRRGQLVLVEVENGPRAALLEVGSYVTPGCGRSRASDGRRVRPDLRYAGRSRGHSLRGFRALPILGIPSTASGIGWVNSLARMIDSEGTLGSTSGSAEGCGGADLAMLESSTFYNRRSRLMGVLVTDLVQFVTQDGDMVVALATSRGGLSADLGRSSGRRLRALALRGTPPPFLPVGRFRLAARHHGCSRCTVVLEGGGPDGNPGAEPAGGGLEYVARAFVSAEKSERGPDHSSPRLWFNIAHLRPCRCLAV